MSLTERAKHKHHIVPRYAGGTNEPGNMTPPISIRLHAMLHLDRYRHVGDVRDLIACRALLGRLTTEEARIATCRVVLRGRVFSAETKVLMRAAQARRRAEGRGPVCSTEGRVRQRAHRLAHPELTAAMHAAVPESNRTRKMSKVSKAKQRRSNRAYWNSEAGQRRRNELSAWMRERNAHGSH